MRKNCAPFRSLIDLVRASSQYVNFRCGGMSADAVIVVELVSATAVGELPDTPSG